MDLTLPEQHIQSLRAESFEAGRFQGRREELEAVVRWLRATARSINASPYPEKADALLQAAEYIAALEHRKEGA